VVLDPTCCCFLDQPFGERNLSAFEASLQSVGQVDAQALAAAEIVVRLCQLQAQLVNDLPSGCSHGLRNEMQARMK
jgi:hypothetical protein